MSSESSNAPRSTGYRFLAARPGAARYQPDPRPALPPKVDLRRHLTPVEDQGRLNSCTANAIAGAYEYLIKKHHETDVDISRLFVYYNARWRDKSQDEDAGSYIQYGMESLQKFGACVEQTWPYQPAAVLHKPSTESYTEASKFRVLDMQQVDVELDHWRNCLADGYPIVFGCALFESFDSSGQRNGRVPMPDPNDVARGSHSRHAMLCVGYSDIDKVFIVRNSWGSEWGDQGYCYMPYLYLMSRKFNGGDCWILRSADNLPSPDDTWVDDDQPLVPGDEVEAVTEYPDDAYDDIDVALHDEDEDVSWEETDDAEYNGDDDTSEDDDAEEETDETSEDEDAEEETDDTSEDEDAEEETDDTSEDEDAEEETDDTSEDEDAEEETDDTSEDEDAEEETDDTSEDEDAEEETDDTSEDEDAEEETDDTSEDEDAEEETDDTSEDEDAEEETDDTSEDKDAEEETDDTSEEDDGAEDEEEEEED